MLTLAKMKRLVKISKEIAEITRGKCNNCPGRCCNKETCEMTIDFAKDTFGVDLVRTSNEIPLFDGERCTVEPYLRPICTVHQCGINSIGFWFDDPKGTKRYFKLRIEMDNLLWQVKE